jgi:putative ABC transport system substrate-binding protein
MAAELVRLNVDVIVTSGTTAVRVLREATTTIPIVMASGEPVSTGLVASLARPGGNITGLTHITKDLLGKRLELLKEIVPDAIRMAALLNPTNPGQALFASEMESSARALALQLKVLKVQDANEFDRAFSTIVEWQARGVLVLEDPMFGTHRARLAELAVRHRLPGVFGSASYAEAGGLVSYGANFIDLHRRSADYVDKILKGAKAGDLPIEQPTKFELVINLKTARALGITVPQSLLLRADKMIQ